MFAVNIKISEEAVGESENVSMLSEVFWNLYYKGDLWGSCM